PGPASGAGDAEKARELRRIKALASASLVAAVALLVVAKLLEPRWPTLAYVAAFAEAAAIGGLADWYAVVALFRHPLGLPIPHTAIVPKNQQRIAEKLGEFIQNHFLTSQAVETKLKQVDFAGFIADWLVDKGRSARLSIFGLRLLPDALSAAENSGLKSYVTQRVMAQVESIDIGPLAAGALRAFLNRERRQTILDELLDALLSTLENDEALAALREKIRAELPTLLNLYRADAFLLRRIVGTAGRFLEEVQADPEHPFRAEFDRMLNSLLDRLESEPGFARKLQSLKHDFLARPELAALGQMLWANAREFVDRSAAGQNDLLRRHLTNAFIQVGEQLRADPEMRAEINGGAVMVLHRFIEDHKGGVSGFISDQVKSWNLGQLVNLIELNIGRDLQYIRFNGMVIGGLAGLLLYVLKQALGLH
ncbi:MAG TPA: DUF445 family protein, partial [Beijerinckiaceae bacterium]|nr:DUF445 family protein [Beijerinckiaceae bacterium]